MLLLVEVSMMGGMKEQYYKFPRILAPSRNKNSKYTSKHTSCAKVLAAESHPGSYLSYVNNRHIFSRLDNSSPNTSSTY